RSPPLPANEHPARGAVVTYARADLPRPPTLVRRQVREVGPMALAGMNDKEPELPHDTQQALDGRNTGAGQLDIVAHEVHVAPVAAEICLHVDDNKRSVLSTQVTVVWPGIGNALNSQRHSASFPRSALQTSPG